MTRGDAGPRPRSARTGGGGSARARDFDLPGPEGTRNPPGLTGPGEPPIIGNFYPFPAPCMKAFLRSLALALVLLPMLLLHGSPIAAAADPAPKAEQATTLPTPLTPAAVRELVSRLSDEEVRKLLLEQLDRTAARQAEPPKPASTGTIGAVSRGAGAARDGIAEIVAAIAAMPGTAREILAKLSEPDGIATLGMSLAMLVLAMAVAAVVELVARRASRRWREGLGPRPSQGFVSDAVRLLMRLALDIAYVLVFGAVVLAIFLVLWQGHEGRRALLLGLLGAVVVARIVAAIANFLLAPSRPQARLLPLDDATATTIARAVIAIAALSGLMVATKHTFEATGTSPASGEAITLLISVLAMGVCLVAVWRVRKPIGDLIRRAGGNGPISGWIADLWPLAASLYLLSVFSGRVWESITGRPGRGEGIMSLVILVALPVADFALSRALLAARTAPEGAGPSILRHLATAYEPVLRRLIHILVIVGGVLALGKIWDLDLFGIAERSVGGQIASALLGIGLVLLLAYITWEIARTAIDRRIGIEAALPEGSPTSRLRTLLPLMRIFIAITLTVMTILSVLAAMGVNIVPLLAGASIVGVAIGFGSQTLVQGHRLRRVLPHGRCLPHRRVHRGRRRQGHGREDHRARPVPAPPPRRAEHPALRPDHAPAQHQPRLDDHGARVQARAGDRPQEGEEDRQDDRRRDRR